jgi:hypothetical protein
MSLITSPLGAALTPWKASESASLPPINVLFAEVLQRQLAQPSAPPVRRPSAWPGFVRAARVPLFIALNFPGSPDQTSMRYRRRDTRTRPCLLSGQLGNCEAGAPRY